MDTAAQGIQFAGADNAKLFFSGPPNRLTGQIPLVNNTNVKQKLRSLTLSSGDLRGVAEMPLQEVPFSARLYPGEQASVPGTFTLDPRTPPGSYEMEVTVGARKLRATAQVTEVVDLRLEPREITILAGSADSYTRQLTAYNAGNVDLPTGAQCFAPIFDSFDLVSSLIMGLNKADRDSVATLAKGFLSEWADLQAGTLTINRDPIVLRPGQRTTTNVEFVLPQELKPLRHYRASLQLYNATLSIDIYTTAKK